MDQIKPKPTHLAAMPREKVRAVFQPTTNFPGYSPSGELLGLYKKGKTYYIREGNTMLAALCAEWVSEGKIIISGG